MERGRGAWAWSVTMERELGAWSVSVIVERGRGAGAINMSDRIISRCCMRMYDLLGKI